MAHQGVKLLRRRLPLRSVSATAWVLPTLLATGCAGASPESAGPRSPSADPARAFDAASPVTPVHARKLRMNLPLPEASAWKVRESEDGTSFEAVHDATHSRLTVRASAHDALMNRGRCEAKAREMGWVPNVRAKIVDDTVTVAPGAYDTRFVAMVDAGATEASPVRGYVFGYGAYVRRCLTMTFVTDVPSGDYAREVASRLATIRVQTFPAITFDTLDDVPREVR
ncbi:MAG: hypothetical protein U0169_12110 [Polyangiaceae bacterium]